MKASGEDGEAPAGGPWEQCFEAAVQLALRAGQVRAAQGARRAHGDLGHIGCRAWRTETLRAGRRGARTAEGSSAPPAHLCTCRSRARTGARSPSGWGRMAAWLGEGGQGTRTASDLTQGAGRGAVARSSNPARGDQADGLSSRVRRREGSAARMEELLPAPEG